MKYTFVNDGCSKMLYTLARLAQDLAVEVPKQYADTFNKEMPVRLNRPENVYLNVLIFLSTKILANTYGDATLIKEFVYSTRAGFGDEYADLLKDELKAYNDLYNDAIKNKENPMNDISALVYYHLTGNEIDMLENMLLTTYLVEAAKLKNAWAAIIIEQ